MPETPPPTEVLTVVFLCWTAGTAAGGAITRLWPEVQAGHFKVIWLATTGLGLAAGFGSRGAWIVAALALLTLAAIYRRLDLPLGLATATAACAVLALDAPLYAFAPAGLLGTVTNAMLLGHWHLNQPKLGTAPISRLVWGMWGAIAAFLAATALLVMRGAGITVFAGVTAIAFAVMTGLLTAVVRHLVGTRSIMSATGILYLQILLAFVSVFTGALAALAEG